MDDAKCYNTGDRQRMSFRISDEIRESLPLSGGCEALDVVMMHLRTKGEMENAFDVSF